MKKLFLLTVVLTLVISALTAGCDAFKDDPDVNPPPIVKDPIKSP